ncbi:MAG: hypothetical protein KC425_26605, partial [Anaerolineales bacterium]|nr:hypothetical protein [Anaerolineales bacterium]
KKPLDADAVLTAVNTALYGEAPPPEPEPATPMAVALPDMVHRRLDSLRADTGAASLVLATVGGQMLLELGQQRGRDVTRLIQMMAQNVRNSFGLGEHLGESVPFTFQYHTGQTLELYTANVGESYFVTLFFSVESRRGRIGTIWVFAQRAIKELAALLPPLDAAAPAQATPAPAPPAPAKRTEPAPAPRAKPRRKTAVPDTAVPEEAAPEPTMPALTGPPEPPPADVTEADMEGLLAALHLDEASVTTDLDSFWDEALQESEGPAQRGNTLSFDQALALVEGLPELTPAADAGQAEVVQAAETAEAEVLEAVDVETAVDMDDLLTALNLAGEPADVDLDAFWDEAMQDDDTSKLRGLTFEEAQRRGLISTDLDLPEG